MKLKTLKAHFTEELASIYPQTEIRSFFSWLVESYLQWESSRIQLNAEEEVSQKHVALFNRAITALKSHKPIQYIVGETEFYGMPFQVNPSVLIPRPETEELVDWIVEDFKTTKNKVQILEIGTGSGCIAISLAHANPHFQVKAIDISKEALKVAQQNANLNNQTILFQQQDVLNLDKLEEKVDIIVSNPPYVKIDEQPQIQPNVLKHEPHIALFVEDSSALIFYQKIIELALTQQNVPTIYVEINQVLGEETKSIFLKAGFNSVTLKKDIYNNPRMIKAVYQ